MKFEIGDKVIVCNVGEVAEELVGLVGTIKVKRNVGNREIGVEFDKFVKSKDKKVSRWYSHSLNGILDFDTGLWFYKNGNGTKFPIEALEIYKDNIEFDF